MTREVDFVVSHKPGVLGSQSVTNPAGETEQVELFLKTYPVVQDEEFPVRVDASTSADECIISLLMIALLSLVFQVVFVIHGH